MVSEQEATATHEAGHAVAALSCGFSPVRVSIVPEPGTRGRSYMDGAREARDAIRDGSLAGDRRRRAQVALALVFLSGPAAERRRTGGAWPEIFHAGGCHTDLADVLACAPDGGSRLERAGAAADWFVFYAWDAIERLARDLFLYRELEEAEILRAIGPGGAPSREFISERALSFWK